MVRSSTSLRVGWAGWGQQGDECRKQSWHGVNRNMIRTHTHKASVRVSELLLRQGNRSNSSASAAPVCLSLETALANLNAICYSVYLRYIVYAATTGSPFDVHQLPSV